MNFEFLKGWATYIGSLFVGAVSFIDKCSQLMNLVFICLGCVGLYYSIRVSLRKLKDGNDKETDK